MVLFDKVPCLVLCQKPIAVELKRKAQVVFALCAGFLGKVTGEDSPHTLLHSQYSTFMSANTTLEHKSKRQVSDKTTSRLIMAECYQDNSIENPLKQEQNSGHFLAKLITDYYYFF